MQELISREIILSLECYFWIDWPGYATRLGVRGYPNQKTGRLDLIECYLRVWTVISFSSRFKQITWYFQKSESRDALRRLTFLENVYPELNQIKKSSKFSNFFQKLRFLKQKNENLFWKVKTTRQERNNLSYHVFQLFYFFFTFSNVSSLVYIV